MELIKLENIYMNYHSLSGMTEAIHNMNFIVHEGEFVAIVGPSGCGKSTLLNIISGLVKPSKGKIKFDNSSSNDNLDKMGYMFQKDNLFEWLSVWDNVTLGLKIKKIYTEKHQEMVKELICNYGLSNFINHKASELSGGMKQRVALIRTLALNPDVLLLDEPFSALDYQTRLKICDEVFSVIKKERKTAIMVTHDLGEAISMADRVIVLSKRPAQILKNIEIKFDESLTPFLRRKEKIFNEYFNILWKELKVDEE